MQDLFCRCEVIPSLHLGAYMLVLWRMKSNISMFQTSCGSHLTILCNSSLRGPPSISCAFFQGFCSGVQPSLHESSVCRVSCTRRRGSSWRLYNLLSYIPTHNSSPLVLSQGLMFGRELGVLTTVEDPVHWTSTLQQR